MDPHSSPTEKSATNLLFTVVQRLTRQSAACKVCGIVFGAGTLLFLASRTGGESLLWAAAPLGFLALADAGSVAKARRLAEAASDKAGNLIKVSEIIRLQVTDGGLRGVVGVLLGVLSFSVWPFYAALGTLVVGLGSMAPAAKTAPSPASPSSYSQPMPFAGYPGSQLRNPLSTPSSPPYSTSPFSTSQAGRVPPSNFPGAPSSGMSPTTQASGYHVSAPATSRPANVVPPPVIHAPLGTGAVKPQAPASNSVGNTLPSAPPSAVK